MIVIPPIKIEEGNLVSSNIAEPSTGEVVWNASTNYSVGSVVIRTATHRKYECQVAGVDAGLPEATPTRWLDIGPTNKWAMFDQNRSIQSVNTGLIEVVISPGKRVNSIGLLGLESTTIRVEVLDILDNVLWDSGIVNTNARLTLTWTDYFFGPFGYKPSYLEMNLPPYSSAKIKVTITNTAGDAKCSGVVLGNRVYLGATQYNARSDSLNFSRIERDDFGNSLLIPRRTVPKTSQTLYANKNLVNTIRKVREDLNAVPALWSGLDEDNSSEYFESILIFGIYKQFEIDIAQPSFAIVTLELEEL